MPKVIAKSNRLSYGGIIESLGVDSTISPKDVTAAQIIRFARALNNSLGHNNLQTLYRIVDGKAEALEFIVNEKTLYTGVAKVKL